MGSSVRFPHRNHVHTYPLPPPHATCPAHLILLDLITQIIIYTNMTLLENTDPLIFTTNPPLFSSQLTKCMLEVYY